MSATIEAESLESRLERLTVDYLRENVNPAPLGGFRQMDEDSEPSGDYCSVSATIDQRNIYGPNQDGWCDCIVAIEYRRGDRVEEDGDDIDAKAFDARWSAIALAICSMDNTDLQEAGSVNTCEGYPEFLDPEERENEDDGRVRRMEFRSTSGIIDPTA